MSRNYHDYANLLLDALLSRRPGQNCPSSVCPVSTSHGYPLLPENGPSSAAAHSHQSLLSESIQNYTQLIQIKFVLLVTHMILL